MEEENKSKRFEMRVSKKKLSDLTRKARRAGISRGEFIRNAIKNKTVGEQPPAEVTALVRELRRGEIYF